MSSKNSNEVYQIHSEELGQINENLEPLRLAYENRPFWDTQLFAGLIGLLTVFGAFALNQIFKKLWNDSVDIRGFTHQFAQNESFYGPTFLFEEALHKSYAHKRREMIAGEFIEQFADSLLSKTTRKSWFEPQLG